VAPPRTPLVELTALSRVPSWFKGGLLLKGGDRNGWERRGREGGDEVGEGQGMGGW